MPAIIIIGTNAAEVTAKEYALEKPGACQFECTASGKLETIELFASQGSTAQKVDIGIYEDAAGKPGELLGHKEVEMGSKAENVLLKAEGFSIQLTAGTKYWLAFVPKSKAITVKYKKATAGTELISNGSAVKELKKGSEITWTKVAESSNLRSFGLTKVVTTPLTASSKPTGKFSLARTIKNFVAQLWPIVTTLPPTGSFFGARFFGRLFFGGETQNEVTTEVTHLQKIILNYVLKGQFKPKANLISVRFVKLTAVVTAAGKLLNSLSKILKGKLFPITGAISPPTIVNKTLSGSGGHAFITIPAATAGNLLVAFFNEDVLTEPFGKDNISGTTGWTTQSTHAVYKGSTFSVWVATKVAVGGETEITSTSEGHVRSLCCFELSGASQEFDVISPTNNVASNTTATSEPITTTDANDLLMAHVGHNENTTISAWTGTGPMENITTGQSDGAGGYYTPNTTLSSATFTANWSPAKVAGMLVVALKPAIPVPIVKLTKVFTFARTFTAKVWSFSHKGPLIAGNETAIGTHENVAYVEKGHTAFSKFISTAGPKREVNTIKFYAKAPSATTSIIVGLYTNASNSPETKLVEKSFSVSAVEGWNEFTGFTTQLDPGEFYWVAISPQGAALKLSLREESEGVCHSREDVAKLDNNVEPTETIGPLDVQIIGPETPANLVVKKIVTFVTTQLVAAMKATAAMTKSFTIPATFTASIQPKFVALGRNITIILQAAQIKAAAVLVKALTIAKTLTASVKPTFVKLSQFISRVLEASMKPKASLVKAFEAARVFQATVEPKALLTKAFSITNTLVVAVLTPIGTLKVITGNVRTFVASMEPKALLTRAFILPRIFTATLTPTAVITKVLAVTKTFIAKAVSAAGTPPETLNCFAKEVKKVEPEGSWFANEGKALIDALGKTAVEPTVPSTTPTARGTVSPGLATVNFTIPSLTGKSIVGATLHVYVTRNEVAGSFWRGFKSLGLESNSPSGTGWRTVAIPQATIEASLKTQASWEELEGFIERNGAGELTCTEVYLSLEVAGKSGLTKVFTLPRTFVASMKPTTIISKVFEIIRTLTATLKPTAFFTTPQEKIVALIASIKATANISKAFVLPLLLAASMKATSAFTKALTIATTFTANLKATASFAKVFAIANTLKATIQPKFVELGRNITVLLSAAKLKAAAILTQFSARVLTASLKPTAAINKAFAIARTFAASLIPTGFLAPVIEGIRKLIASMQPTATIAKSFTLPRTLVASVKPTFVVLERFISKALSAASMKPTATFAKVLTIARTFAAEVKPKFVALGRNIFKVEIASMKPTVVMTKALTIIKTFAAELKPTALFTKLISIVTTLTAQLKPTAAVSKALTFARTFTAQITASGTFTKILSITKAFVASVKPTALTSKVLTIARTFVAKVNLAAEFRRVEKGLQMLVASMAATANLSKSLSMSKILEAVVKPTATISKIMSVIKTLTATMKPKFVTLERLVVKVFGAVLKPTSGALAKAFVISNTLVAAIQPKFVALNRNISRKLEVASLKVTGVTNKVLSITKTFAAQTKLTTVFFEAKKITGEVIREFTASVKATGTLGRNVVQILVTSVLVPTANLVKSLKITKILVGAIKAAGNFIFRRGSESDSSMMV